MDKFSKTLSHTKLKILQKYGNAEHTVDEEFEAMRLRLENLYRFHQNHTTYMRKYEDIIAQLGKSSFLQSILKLLRKSCVRNVQCVYILL
jgi:hypothetical protein